MMLFWNMLNVTIASNNKMTLNDKLPQIKKKSHVLLAHKLCHFVYIFSNTVLKELDDSEVYSVPYSMHSHPQRPHFSLLVNKYIKWRQTDFAGYKVKCVLYISYT